MIPMIKNKKSNFNFLETAEHILLTQPDRFQTSIVTVISITSLSTITLFKNNYINK